MTDTASHQIVLQLPISRFQPTPDQQQARLRMSSQHLSERVEEILTPFGEIISTNIPDDQLIRSETQSLSRPFPRLRSRSELVRIEAVADYQPVGATKAELLVLLPALLGTKNDFIGPMRES